MCTSAHLIGGKFWVNFEVALYDQKCTSEDVRWRMVWQNEAFGFTTQGVVVTLDVDATTLWRVLDQIKAYSPRRRNLRTIQLTIVHSILKSLVSM